jgi:hypothetical protein
LERIDPYARGGVVLLINSLLKKDLPYSSESLGIGLRPAAIGTVFDMYSVSAA